MTSVIAIIAEMTARFIGLNLEGEVNGKTTLSLMPRAFQYHPNPSAPQYMAYMTQKEGKTIPDARRSIPRACKRSQASQPPSHDCFLNRNVKVFAAKDEPDADAHVQASISKAKQKQYAHDKKIAIAQNRAAIKERKRIQDRNARERQRIKDACALASAWGAHVREQEQERLLQQQIFQQQRQ